MSRAARIGILAALAWVWAGPAGADVSRRLTLVRDGRPAAAIVIGAEAGFAPSFAAWELQLHIRKITGAELPIATDRDPPAGTRILVGAGRLTEALGLRGDAFKPQEYLIAFRPDTLVLMGCDRRDDAYPVCLDGRPERVEGRFGKALEFGGACRALSVEGPGFSDEAGTLEAWVWLGPRRLDAGTIFRLDGNPWTYHIVDTRGETVCYTVYDGSAGRSVASPKLADGWHHLCAVHDAAKGEFELFVDGASCGAAAYTLTTCAAAPYLHLGAFVSDGVARNRFVGRIDAARLSRVARAPSPGRADAPGAVDADTTVALDFDEESGPPREGSGRFRRPSPPPLRDAFEARGTCDAAFDFLERFCGVRWYAPTDLGLVHPTRATLQVEGADVRRAPAFEFRHHAPSGIAHAYVGLAPAPSDEELRLFVCRRRLGGRNFMTNHSFYDYYDRFWERNPARPDLFEGRWTEFFARGYEGRPPQLCYTDRSLAAQVVADARARLDQGAEYVQLVPMDNDQHCRCEACRALFDEENRSRHFSSGKASALFWTFANRVARELRASHPEGRVGALAYFDYAFPPPFELEPNILVGPCLHTRNWWCPAMERNDLAFYKGWCAKAPGRLHCLWLYQCFPYERGDVYGFRAFPGFHAHTLGRQFRMFAADGVRGIFLCGVADYIDGYLTLRSLDDPFFDIDAALEEFFTGYYGPAGPAMRRLYLEIERVYMDPANYPEAVRTEDAHFHQTEEMAWRYLGTRERLAAWGALLEEAEAAARSAEQKERVAVFRKDLWGPMAAGRAQWEAKRGER